MAILRNPNKDKFTVVDNFALRDENLSLKARGLLITMLSLPDNWKFSENGLCSIFQKDGQSAIRSGIKELEENGYLIRNRERDEKGRISNVDWIIFDYPHFENPNMVIPNLGNRPQYNTNQSNTNESSTENNRSAFSESTLPKGQMEAPERANESNQKGEPIPDNNTPNYTPNNQYSGRNLPARKSYGEYGWVKLSDAEYNKLLNDYGIDKLNHTIKYIDELAQSTGNKNKWKDWNLVVRRAIRDGWGIKPGEVEEEPKKQRRFETVLIDGEYVSVEV